MALAGLLLSAPAIGPQTAVAGQSVGTQTCPLWSEPMTYQPRLDEPDNAMYHKAPAVFGESVAVPEMRIELLDKETGKKIGSDDVRVIYTWRWYEPPDAKHPNGSWTETGDSLACRMDSGGEIRAGAHVVRPRGWYDGEFMRKPEFTGITIVEVNEDGQMKVSLKPGELKRFEDSELVIRVGQGAKGEMSWQAKDTRFG